MKKLVATLTLSVMVLLHSNLVLASTSDPNFVRPASDALPCLISTGTPLVFDDESTTTDDGGIMMDFVFERLTRFVFTNRPTERVVKGIGNNKFGSTRNLSRFEMTKIALGANCIEWFTSPVPNTKFIDVPKDNSEMSLVIGKAHAEGIIDGIGDRFYPQQHVTKGEFLKILLAPSMYFSHGQAVQPLSSRVAGVTDNSFRQFVEHAERMKMIGANNFQQNTAVIRYDMAMMLLNYIDFMKKTPRCDYITDQPDDC